MPRADLIVALPEIVLACAAMALMMVGVFSRRNATDTVATLAVVALAGVAVLVTLLGGGKAEAFGGLFVTDRFAVFAKLLVLLGSALSIIMSSGYIEREDMKRFEYPVLMLFATLGMMLMISANDLIALYMGVEMQSLALYVVAAFRRDTVRSTEAGLKYFVLGAVSSGMLLYGMSLVYGFAGTTEFGALAGVLATAAKGKVSIGLLVGMVFVIAGIAFKISAVPFHMWTPDVYEGAPTPVTAFFAAAPKMAAMALFLRILMAPFVTMAEQWQQIVVVLSIASMLLGAFAAINQRNIKRLMAYSSIGNVGYALVGLAAATPDGVRGVLVYMAIYVVMTLGAFACILCMKVQDRMVEDISDLAGLSKTRPAIAFWLAVFMFSMAGIPPLAGFFGKLYVFMAAVDAGLIALAVIGVLTSVVSAFYYMRIVKVMYFDEPAEAFDADSGRGLTMVMASTGTAILVLFPFVGVLVDAAAKAAASLGAK